MLESCVSVLGRAGVGAALSGFEAGGCRSHVFGSWSGRVLESFCWALGRAGVGVVLLGRGAKVVGVEFLSLRRAGVGVMCVGLGAGWCWSHAFGF